VTAARARSGSKGGARWSDWRVLYSVALAAAVLLAGFGAGWSHAPYAFVPAFFGLVAAHGVLLGLGAATEGSHRWLRCSWGLSGLLLLG